MKYSYYILLVLSVLTLQAKSQDKLSDQRVEVIKNYSPEVDKAAKLTPMPNMVDTVRLYPESSYNIFEQAWQTSFGVEPYKPVMVDTATENSNTTPFYIKAGVGAALNSVFDFYSSGKWSQTQIVGFINHEGSYSKIDNQNASQTLNNVGFNLTQGVNQTKQFKVNLLYDYDYYRRYSTYQNSDTKQSVNYSTASVGLYFGDDFSNPNKLNFGISALGNNFGDGTYTQNDFNTEFKLAYGFGVNKIGLKAGFDGAFMGDADYTNTTINVAPSYGLEIKRYKFDAGLKFSYDNLNSDASLYVFPYLRMTYDLAKGYVVPFIELDGEIEKGNFREFARENPYIISGYTGENNVVYNFKAGIWGSAGKWLSYNLHAGVDIYRNIENFVYYNAGFYTFSDKATCFSLGGDIQVKPVRSLVMNLSADYFLYNLRDWKEVGSRPNFKLNYLINYSLSDKLFVRAEAEVLGTRYFYQSDSYQGSLSRVKKGTTVDVSLGVDYKINSMIMIFIEGNNLANAELYPFNHYKGFGIEGRTGVKLIF